MKTITRSATSLLLCLSFGCASLDERLPITLLDPDIQDLTVSVNGVTIKDPDGPFLWDWGDGTIEESYFPNSHSFEKPGFYRITVEVSRKGHSKTEHLYLRIAD